MLRHTSTLFLILLVAQFAMINMTFLNKIQTEAALSNNKSIGNKLISLKDCTQKTPSTPCKMSENQNNQEYLLSNNERFKFMLQTDMNAVIYDLSVTKEKAIWSTGKTDKVKSAMFILQDDGNIVLEASAGNKVRWNSKSYGKGTGPYTLTLQDDGNLVLKDSKNIQIWCANC